MAKFALWLVVATAISMLSTSGATKLNVSKSEYLYRFDDNSAPVVDHTDETSFRNSAAPKIVEFYSPYCGGCRAFKPKYIAMAKSMTKEYKEVEFYAISCVAHKSVCSSYKLEGYPTVLAFPAGSKEGTKLQRSAIHKDPVDTAAIAKALNIGGETTEARRLAEKGGHMKGKLVNKKESGDKGKNRKKASKERVRGEKESKDEKEKKEEEVKDSDKAETKKEEPKESVTPEPKKEEEVKESATPEPKKEEPKESATPEPKKEEPKESVTPEPKKEESKESATPEPKKDEPKESVTPEPKKEEVKESATPEPEKQTKGDNEAEPKKGGETEKGEEKESKGGDDDKERNKQEVESQNDWEENVDEDDGTYMNQQYRDEDSEMKLSQKNEAGADMAKVSGVGDMDKWKDALKKRRDILEARRKKKLHSIRSSSSYAADGNNKISAPHSRTTLDKPSPPGQTKTMMANTPGTDEFKERQQMLLDLANKVKRGDAFSSTSIIDPETVLKKDALPFKREPRKPSFIQKQAEKIPVVKRMFKMSPEEELILDATLSFTWTMRELYTSSGTPLTDVQKDALTDWLDLLSVSLPPEWGLHALIDDLSAQIDYISSNKHNMLMVLAKHPMPRVRWSNSCQNVVGGKQNCGFWKLLHIVTVGVAEHKGGLNLVEAGIINAAAATFTPAEAANTMHDFIAAFFPCDVCKKDFLSVYDTCKYRRCVRLTDKLEGTSPDDWKQLALWLWEVHNGVNVRLLQEKAAKDNPGSSSESINEIQALFPSVENCLACFSDSGEWNENSVFSFLEKTYWDSPDAKLNKLLSYRGEDATGGGLIWFMLVVAIAIIYVLRAHIDAQSGLQRLKLPALAAPASLKGMKHKLEDTISGKKRTA